MILKKIKSVFFYTIISAAVLIPVQSCSLLSEPEPYENRDAHALKMQYKTPILIDYSQDQILRDVVSLQFVPDFIERVDSITVFVDSVKESPYINYTKLPQRSYQISIDTKRYSNGEHDVIFYVYKKPAVADSLGILSLITDAFYIYRTSLIFDNTPVTALLNILVTLQNKNARISWDTTNFYFFHSYTIRKNGNVIAEIFSQNVSTYTDTTTLPDFFSMYFEVGVTISGQNTVYSSPYNFKQGETLPFTAADFIIDNLNDQVIFGKSNYLTAVSTQSCEIINQTTIDYNAPSAVWSKSINNDTLYSWDNAGENFLTYTVNPLKLVNSQHPSNGNTAHALEVGPDNKLYISFSGTNSFLFIYNDVKNLSSLNYSVISLERFYRFLSMSPDGRNLLAVDDNGIKSYAIENDSLIFKFQTTSRYSILLFRNDWNNSRMFIKRRAEIVELWDTQTLNPISSYQLPESNPSVIEVTSFFANLKNLYVAYTIYFVNSQTTLLAEYDINNRQLTRSWIFPSIVHHLLGSEKGRYLFASTSSEQWIVDLGVAQ